MSEHLIPTVIDCSCGLRYMRTAIQTLTPEIGQALCDCGRTIGSWKGPYRLTFEPEDHGTPWPHAQSNRLQ